MSIEDQTAAADAVRDWVRRFLQREGLAALNELACHEELHRAGTWALLTLADWEAGDLVAAVMLEGR